MKILLVNIQYLKYQKQSLEHSKYYVSDTHFYRCDYLVGFVHFPGAAPNIRTVLRLTLDLRESRNFSPALRSEMCLHLFKHNPEQFSRSPLLFPLFSMTYMSSLSVLEVFIMLLLSITYSFNFYFKYSHCSSFASIFLVFGDF